LSPLLMRDVGFIRLRTKVSFFIAICSIPFRLTWETR
jgi:hypothetical protein